ncbi:NAD-dependent epimerase/dehydratase family protein [Sphingomonas sp. NFX23]|uniref:NAD-dependent epimerase/dehydratase family protein n=1 Tax=Sphingomonas sp. NFX23 TaxID=2819532 RepID=UPI003CEE13B1
MSILVTGAAGGIGRALVPRLVGRGVDVTAAVRRIPHDLGWSGVRVVSGDLAEDDLAPMLDGISVVVHLAARSSPWGKRSVFERDNVVATTRLLAAAGHAGVRRFVFASSPAIFAARRHRLDLRADSPPADRPINDYAWSKLLAERTVQGESRMSTLVIRPSAVIGDGDRAILPRLLRVMQTGWLPLGNGGSAMFHPTDMRDAAEAFECAAMGDARGIINVAGREPVRVAVMARTLAARLNLKLMMPNVPEALLNGASVTSEWLGRLRGSEPAVTRYSASTLSWSRTFSLTDAELKLGWQPRFGPAEMLDRIVPC